MFTQMEFGKRLKNIRKARNLTQSEVASRIEISEQAVSKWETGECLPDVYNLKLLARLFRISIDSLLEDDESGERVIEVIKIGESVFEIIEKPETILAGKMLYAKDFTDIDSFNFHIESVDENQKQSIYNRVVDCIPPVCDIGLSVNFWLEERSRAFGFVRETTTKTQPEGVDIFNMPASLFIRAYTDKATAQLMTREQCEIWELFAYIRNYFMPAHGFKMAENGAQEMEVYDTTEHSTGYAYMPVVKI